LDGFYTSLTGGFQVVLVPHDSSGKIELVSLYLRGVETGKLDSESRLESKRVEITIKTKNQSEMAFAFDASTLKPLPPFRVSGTGFEDVTLYKPEWPSSNEKLSADKLVDVIGDHIQDPDKRALHRQMSDVIVCARWLTRHEYITISGTDGARRIQRDWRNVVKPELTAFPRSRTALLGPVEVGPSIWDLLLPAGAIGVIWVTGITLLCRRHALER
jgi:hypothetical protein